MEYYYPPTGILLVQKSVFLLHLLIYQHCRHIDPHCTPDLSVASFLQPSCFPSSFCLCLFTWTISVCFSTALPASKLSHSDHAPRALVEEDMLVHLCVLHFLITPSCLQREVALTKGQLIGVTGGVVGTVTFRFLAQPVLRICDMKSLGFLAQEALHDFTHAQFSSLTAQPCPHPTLPFVPIKQDLLHGPAFTPCLCPRSPIRRVLPSPLDLLR